MLDGKLTLALVPARGGSKGVPGKNIRLIAGKPTLAWTVECALACPSIDRVVVSTDDEEIASVARAAGADVPFRRPGELAADDTPDLPVYRHALSALSDGGFRPEIVVWLRPTAPLRTTSDVEGVLALLAETEADCVRSICPVEHHPFWMRRLVGDQLVSFVDDVDENDYPQRQLLPAVYRLNGVADAVRSASVSSDASVLFGGDVRGFVMARERSVDLDDELDFVIAEALLRQRVNS